MDIVVILRRGFEVAALKADRGFRTLVRNLHSAKALGPSELGNVDPSDSGFFCPLPRYTMFMQLYFEVEFLTDRQALSVLVIMACVIGH